MKEHHTSWFLLVFVCLFSSLGCMMGGLVPSRATVTDTPAATEAVIQTEPFTPTATPTPPGCEISSDPNYGYTAEVPVRIGGETRGALVRADQFVDRLVEANGATFEKRSYPIMKVDAGSPIYVYTLTFSGGVEHKLYLSMSDPIDTKAPMGLKCLLTVEATATADAIRDAIREARPTKTITPTLVPNEISLNLSDELIDLEGGFAFRPAAGFTIERSLATFFLTDLQGKHGYLFSNMQLSGSPTAQEAAYYILTEAYKEKLKVDARTMAKVGNESAIAITFHTLDQTNPLQGKIYVAKLGNTMYWIGLGGSSVSEWDRIGKDVFELMISSVRFDVGP